MKITPIHKNEIKINVEEGSFRVCGLTEGIQILGEAGHKLDVKQREESVVVRIAK